MKTSNYKEWVEQKSSQLSNGGVWLRGGELNTISPQEFDKKDLKALFVRLSTYLDTGYSFTHQFLYQIAADTDGVYPDLAYLPPPKDAEVFEKDNIPWLLGTQSKYAAESFDVIGFSNSIVQELINIPHFLSKSSIPLSKQERMNRPDLPLIILGGANALFSSCIWLGEGLVDGVFVGESDKALKKILEICRDCKRQGLPKTAWLEKLCEVPGFFEPEKKSATKKNFAMSLNESQALKSGPIYYLSDQLGSGHLQISEGCPCFCSFCAETWERRPYRERSAKTLKEAALQMKAHMGLDSIEIYSFNFNMHSELYQVLWDLLPHFKHIGLKSQRFDLLAHDPEMLKFQQVLGKTSLTCGLEGISPRLREYLNKNLNNEDLHNSIEAIFKNKAREMKVFLIATGLEEEQDFIALGDMLDHIQEIRAKTTAQTRVIFSMTPLVRFPWTPLEFEKAPPAELYASIIDRAARSVRQHGFEFRESADLPEYWVSQALVRASDPKVTSALLSTIQKTGFVYYRSITEEFQKQLSAELLAEGLSEEILFAEFSLEESKAKPWARVDAQVSRDYLWSMYQKLKVFKETDYCLGRSWTKARCSHCGGCPTRFHVRDIVLATQKKPHRFEDFKARKLKADHSEKKFSFKVSVGPSSLGVQRKMLGVALARAFMLAEPGLTETYRGYAGSFWDEKDTPVWIAGEDRIDLFFDTSAEPILLNIFKNSTKIENINKLLGNNWGSVLELLSTETKPVHLKLNSRVSINIEDFLKQRGLKYSLRKTGEGAYQYDFIPQALKKGIFSSLRKSPLSYEFTLGPKFNWIDFEKTVLNKHLKSKTLNQISITHTFNSI